MLFYCNLYRNFNKNRPKIVFTLIFLNFRPKKLIIKLKISLKLWISRQIIIFLSFLGFGRKIFVNFYLIYSIFTVVRPPKSRENWHFWRKTTKFFIKIAKISDFCLFFPILLYFLQKSDPKNHWKCIWANFFLN